MAQEKFTIEYGMKSVPVMLLWSYISTASGLEQWFADKVKHDAKKFSFFWNGTSTDAMQISMRTGVNIRFRWCDSEDKSYFEMKISVSELTDETVLVVTDFAETDDLDDSKKLWSKQVAVLRRMLGC